LFVEVPVVGIAERRRAERRSSACTEIERSRTPSAPLSIHYHAAPRGRYQRRVEQGKGEEAASLTSTQPNRPGI
jgi:NADH:ubiquinone oxidoreductase subunit D